MRTIQIESHSLDTLKRCCHNKYDGLQKYVYDFGDWIEHQITLEEIIEPQKGIDYPRLADQNKPRYQYCQHCKEEGRKTVATWICIECSDVRIADVLVCRDCLNTHHEERYADEALY